MCPGARGAELDFLTLVSQLGSPLYGERFLSHGFESLPRRYQRLLPRLQCWTGIAGLQRQVAQVIGQPAGCPLYFFGQSDGLMRFAAESLCRRARAILTTDLEWPPYLQRLRQVANERGCQVVTLRLHDCVLRDLASSTDVAERILTAHERHHCDGLFLSDITYLGMTLPIAKICQQLPDRNRQFVVIDGAQAFGQRPVKLSELDCDLYLTGTQKWVQAYHPLRMAIGGRRGSASTLIATHQSLTHYAYSFDPLHRFCASVLTGDNDTYGETVNLIALITAAGALAQGRMDFIRVSNRWHMQLQSVARLRSATGLNVKGHASLKSGIALVVTRPNQEKDSIRWRLQLHRQGVVASVFNAGLVRIAVPQFYVPAWILHLIETAIESVAQ